MISKVSCPRRPLNVQPTEKSKKKKKYTTQSRRRRLPSRRKQSNQIKSVYYSPEKKKNKVSKIKPPIKQETTPANPPGPRPITKEMKMNALPCSGGMAGINPRKEGTEARRKNRYKW
jgi:hypothetical protein